jgi:hypothetical protein
VSQVNVPRRTSRTPPRPLVLKTKSTKKAGLQPVAQSGGSYPVGLFGYRAKPKEAKRDVIARLVELVIRLKKKKKALIGNDRGQTLPLDGSDYVNPMTGAPTAR